LLSHLKYIKRKYVKMAEPIKRDFNQNILTLQKAKLIIDQFTLAKGKLPQKCNSLCVERKKHHRRF